MHTAIRERIAFYIQRFHVPIDLAVNQREINHSDKRNILVCVPDVSDQQGLGEAFITCKEDFGKGLAEDPVFLEGRQVGRKSDLCLVLTIAPDSLSSESLICKLIDLYLPQLALKYRRDRKQRFVDNFVKLSKDHNTDLEAAIRSHDYELDSLNSQLASVTRQLEVAKLTKEMFDHPPEWLGRRFRRSFVELMQMIPNAYAAFDFQGGCVIGTTHPIIISYEDFLYHFDPYRVEVNLMTMTVNISGGTEVNGYIHPHITARLNICWGNIGTLVQGLLASYDLPGLFQLVRQFLISYNRNDPYQRIEYWDSEWSPDEDGESEEYCSWCDEYGHSREDCEYCWWCESCEDYVDHDVDHCPRKVEAANEAA